MVDGVMRATSKLALAPPAEIDFDLARKPAFNRFQFSHMEDGGTQLLIDLADDLGVISQVMRQSVGRYLLIEPLEGRDLAAQFSETFLLSALPARHIAAPRPVDLERSAEHTLLATQKVGRSLEYPVLSNNHKASSLPHGYETP